MENNTLFVQHYWYKSDSSPLGRRTAPSSPNHRSPLGFLLLFSFHNLFCLCVLLCYVSGVKDMCYPKEGRDDPAMVSCQGVSRESWERVKEGGFDWWMVWKRVSWGGSSTIVNFSPCTHPLCVRNSHMCIKADVFLSARSISWCWCVLPGVDTVQGIQKVEWLWGWWWCRAAISLMLGHPQHCVSYHIMRQQRLFFICLNPEKRFETPCLFIFI